MATDPLFEALVGHINGSKPLSVEEMQRLMGGSPQDAPPPPPAFEESEVSFETAQSAPEPVFSESQAQARSPQDRWDTDLRNILIINFTQVQDKMRGAQRDQRDNAMSNVHLSNQHLVQTALRTTEAKISSGELSPDQDLTSEVRRSTYRAKALNGLVPRTPW